MEGNGDLNQALKKLFFWAVSFPPHVFPSLMSVEKATLVEELNATAVLGHLHRQIVTGRSYRTNPGAVTCVSTLTIVSKLRPIMKIACELTCGQEPLLGVARVMQMIVR